MSVVATELISIVIELGATTVEKKELGASELGVSALGATELGVTELGATEPGITELPVELLVTGTIVAGIVMLDSEEVLTREL